MNVVLSNESLQEVIQIAQSIAKENYNSKYSGAHILQALLHKSFDVYDFLDCMGKDPQYVYEWAEVRIEDYPKTTQQQMEIQADEHVQGLWEYAEEVRNKLGLQEITPLCLLLSLVKPYAAFTAEQLQSFPLSESELFAAIQVEEDISFLSSKLKISEKTRGAITQSKKTTALAMYCADLLAQSTAGNCDTAIVGREKEIRTLVEIVERKSKSNVILVGEPGVGKTALIEGFAKLLQQGRLSTIGRDQLYQLDLGLLVAGTSYKGEVEERLKKVLDECKWQGGMLVIDEIHKFVDSKGNFSGLANLLIPNLTKGDITVIGTTTVEEYRKLIEPEGSFNRRFEKLEVQEPDEETCVKMLESSVQNYTIYHGIQVEPEALVTCVALAKRYAKEKKLPDTAFDLLDQTMAAVKLLDEQAIATLIDWKIDYDKSLSKNFVDDEAKCKEIVWLFTQLQHRISPILLGLLTEQPQLELYMGSEVLQFIIGLVYDELVANAEHKITSVSKVELTAVMAAKTGIPIGKIQVQEKEKLLALEELLGHRVVGQQHALKVVSDAIIESRSGLNKPGQPIGSFFFLGPTGTGKTELAKAIASLLFNDEKAMIRFDMSEFKEEHSAALLYGAPPGYIGYEEGGMLVNKIRQQPYAVVLFDEIEKAHPSVFDVFLQLMDEGKIHDKLGKVGDFSNALILFTSNIGSEEISAAFGAHRIPTSKELMQWMTGCFRPEFLARITEIVPFAPITEEMAEQIFTIQLKVLMTGLHHLQIAFEITDVALKKLAIAGFTAEYGARQINSVIRQQIARPISKMLVREELVAGQKIRVDWQNDAVVFQVTDEE